MTRTRSKRRIVIIGAGKIGCAHVAALFAGAGWQITLVARNEATVQRIRAAREYTVRTTDGDSQLIAADAALIGTAAFDEAVAAADLVATAVGARNVTALAEPLARALGSRPA